MLTISLIFTLFTLGILALLGWWSPGKPEPFLDSFGTPLRGSISEKIFLDIYGSRQGMIIKGRDVTRPVLLYIHGGIPDYFLSNKYPTGLENEFVVVWWEQRGIGLSFVAGQSEKAITSEQLVADVITLTNYLRDRFDKDKIYLMGHSGGTFIGIQAAAMAPELYHAYIGVAQMSNQLRSEKRAYDFMLKRFTEEGKKRMVRKLNAAPVTLEKGTPRQYLVLRDAAMHRLGVGTTHNMRSVITGIFLPSLQFPEYTIGEKFRLWQSKSRAGVSILWDQMLLADLSESVPELSIPVYFFHGIFDYTCSYEEAKWYFQGIRAPLKGFYTFHESAHSPMFEEPAKVLHILRSDVLHGLNNLADEKG